MCPTCLASHADVCAMCREDFIERDLIDPDEPEAAVLIQIIRVYKLDVPPGTDDPIAWAYSLSVDEIEERGIHKDTTTDHAEEC